VKSKAIILVIIFVVGIAIAVLMVEHQYSPEIITIGSVAPDIELIDSNQNTLKLSELKGSVVLINFWATWCEPCIEELPSIETLFRHFSNNPRFQVITILFKDDRQKALWYMKENGYTFPVYLNPDGSAAKKFKITGVPETFIIDKQGVLRDKMIGPEQWDSPVILETLNSLINEQ
jgi:cytochrome c biogenesis protein CcmG/thiol:disulfide interchange protein DsbE